MVIAAPKRIRKREERPEAPDMSSGFWERAVALGLPSGERDGYLARFEEQARQKKRHGLVTGLTLSEEAWQELAYEFTDLEMGRALGLLSAAVTVFRKRRGIETLTQRQRRDRSQGRLLSLDDLTQTGLANLIAKMPLKAVAQLYGVAPPAIRARCRQWGIYVPSKSERSVSDKTLTEEHKQVIWGMLLGDGRLDEGFFSVTHGYEQYEYLLHCRELIAPIARSVRYDESVKENGTLCHEFMFRTDNHLWLKSERLRWYPNGSRTKQYPPDVIDQLTPLALAIWFMDDGNRGDLASFALGDIPLELAEEITRRTGLRFGLDTYLKPHSRLTTCKIMAIRGSSLDRFFSLIKEHVPNNLLYKLPSAYWTEGTRPQGRVKEQDTKLFPKQLAQRSKDYAILTSEDQEQLVRDVVAYWRREKFPFHEPRVRDLRTLLNVRRGYVLKKDVIKAWQVGQSSCLAFQPHYWRTTVQGKEGDTPIEKFERDDDLHTAVVRLLEKGKVPNAPRIRSALSGGHNSVSNFRPSAAKVIVERFCPAGGLVWDPCAGWGGRLLGALTASSVVRYIACEPQPSTMEGLRSFVEWLSAYLPGADQRVELHQIPAEDFDPPSGLDLVFTSPPYFKKELYGYEDTQSWVRYPTYRAWVENFLAPVMTKAYDRLRPGGWLVLNVADVVIGGEQYEIVHDVRTIAEELGLGEPEILRYALPSLFGEGREEPVLCWSKSTTPVYHAGGPGLHLVMCDQCGRVTDHRVLRAGICPPCDAQIVRCRYPGCGRDLPGAIASRKYCDACALKVDAERARKRRQEYRNENPVKTSRTFTCSCGATFEVPLDGGRPQECPACVNARSAETAEKETAARTKTCAYRHCGQEFVDHTPKNTAKFCHEEHRRREKQFRQGKVSSVADFRKSDPVLGEGPLPSVHTCHECGESFEQPNGKNLSRCSNCDEKARQKVCATEGCGIGFLDSSLRNNRQFCDECQMRRSGRTGKREVIKRRLDPEKLRLLAQAGVPIRRMAELLEVPASTVSRHLKKHGIEHPRTKGNPNHR